MARMLQVYNPVHNHRLPPGRLNVMGRVMDDKIKHVNVLLDHALVRRVRVANSGAFECRMDLSEAQIGKHEVEVRAISGHRTERLLVPFFLAEPEKPQSETPVTTEED